MKAVMRIAGLFFLSMTAAAVIGYLVRYKPKFNQHKKSVSFYPIPNASVKSIGFLLKEKAKTLHGFIKKENYNSTICFLIDMSINPGRRRFFVYNLETDSIEKAGLVTHGSGSARVEEPYFSNEPGSNCTSLGKYRIGKSYMGSFGLAYKLYGLDKTNNKAFERFIVLHSHACVPAEEVYPLPICESWGCPTVAPSFLQTLRKYIDSSEKPVLLYIYQ